MTTLASPPAGPARRIVYLGTPEVAVAPLRALHASGTEIALVVTREDKRRGRGGSLSPSAVKSAAQELGLPVSHAMSDIAAARPELGVVVAYGRIIPVDLLRIVPMINVHFSLLPRWRGAAPVERALLAGDTETGICIMRIEEGLDTGEVYERVVVPVRPEHTLSTLREELVNVSLTPLVRAVTLGCGHGEPQSGLVTHAAKLELAELQIHFTMSARHVVALTRLESAWFTYTGGNSSVMRVRVVSAVEVDANGEPGSVMQVGRDGVVVACGDRAVRLVTVQPAGKSEMSAGAWANGARLPASLA